MNSRYVKQDITGSASLFFVIVLTPLVAISLLVAEAGNRVLAQVRLQNSLRTCTMSLASCFDQELLSWFGIYALPESEEELVELQDGMAVELTKSLGEFLVFREAVCRRGLDQGDVVAVDRVVDKLQSLLDLAKVGQETLDEARGQVGEIASDTVLEVIGANMPQVNFKEIVQGLWQMGTILGNNWNTMDWSWLYDSNTEMLNMNSIFDQVKTMLNSWSSWEENLSKRVASSSYVLTYFTAYDKALERQAVFPNAEAEYCVFGKSNGALNIVDSYDWLFKFRLAINFLDFLVNLNIPEPETLLVMAVVMSLISTLTDMASLMAGDTVPLSPELDMVDTEYRDYLAIMLLTANPDQVIGRVGDVISACNLSRGKEPLICYYTCISVTFGGEMYSFDYGQ